MNKAQFVVYVLSTGSIVAKMVSKKYSIFATLGRMKNLQGSQLIFEPVYMHNYIITLASQPSWSKRAQLSTGREGLLIKSTQ